MIRLVFICSIFLSACSTYSGMKKHHFEYWNEGEKKTVLIQVPSPFADKKMILDTTGGKELYYYYANGALFYVARSVSWPTENQAFIDKLRPSLREQNQFSFTGKDETGLFWKEIRVEGFRFGYTYVSTAQKARFEQAINSIRIRK
jgi:hypothetical protein